MMARLLKNKVYNQDCIDFLKSLPDNSIDSIVTDPPAGIAFMNKEWDKSKGGKKEWINWMESVMIECLRVLKPGGHVLVWSIPRTSHWTASAVEDAGFEIRDTVLHIFGSGFPKSMDISKQIDKMFGAKQWEGWGTALKPAHESWILARKPLEKGLTVAQNILKWGTGAINIDGCRIELREYGEDKRMGGNGTCKTDKSAKTVFEGGYIGNDVNSSDMGRFPSNLILDDSSEVQDEFDKYGIRKSGAMKKHYEYINTGNSMGKPTGSTKQIHDANEGSVSRFFYCAKASVEDRDEGLDGFDTKRCGMMEDDNYPIKTGSGNLRNTQRKNHHPTVKNTSLMIYLCRLITPTNGIILDPFSGSGSTGKAAILEDFNFIGCELYPEYTEIANARIEYAIKNKEKLKKKYSNTVDKILPKSDDNTNDFF